MGHVTKSTRYGDFLYLLTWMVFHFLILTNGQEIDIRLRDRVFVAFKGENFNISYQLKKPANQSGDALTCFDPFHKQIYQIVPSATVGHEIDDNFLLKNVTTSGEYYCQYKTARASWFVRVRDTGYKEVWSYSDTEVIIASVVTGVLLVFSVGGSIFVFRGNWGCCKNLNKTQKSDARQEETEHTAKGEPAQSTSLYASLEARPASVYDILDHSAAASAGGQQAKAKTPMQKDAPKKAGVPPQKQDEGIFECVYENF